MVYMEDGHCLLINSLSTRFQSKGTTKLFLDLRSASINTAISTLETESFVNSKSYTESLISLRDFGTLGNSTDEPSVRLRRD